MYMYHHKGKSTEETFASHIFKSQAISTSTVPPKIANLEQVAITVKEVPSLLLSLHHIPTVEVKLSSQHEYKNDWSQGFMAIFC